MASTLLLTGHPDYPADIYRGFSLRPTLAVMMNYKMTDYNSTGPVSYTGSGLHGRVGVARPTDTPFGRDHFLPLLVIPTWDQGNVVSIAPNVDGVFTWWSAIPYSFGSLAVVSSRAGAATTTTTGLVWRRRGCVHVPVKIKYEVSGVDPTYYVEDEIAAGAEESAGVNFAAPAADGNMFCGFAFELPNKS